MGGFMVLVSSVTMAADASDLVQYVDPYIGSGGHGHVFLGTSVPFGAIQAGPSNIHKGWDWCSGYHYSDTVMIGFSHLHLSGTGCTDLGDILIMPFTGEIQTDKGTQENPDAGYASRYRHETETARPEYYAVPLDDYKVKAELTATERAAMHRYQFPADQTGRIIVDLQEGNGDEATETFIEKIDEKTFGGYRYSKGWAKDQWIYFAIQFQKAPAEFAVYDGGAKLDGTSGKSNKIKGVLSLAPSKEPVLMKVAISPVSVENAIGNIAAEMPHWKFQKVVNQSRKKWNKELAAIRIDGTDKQKRIFYTAMYHTMIAPALYNDHNGDYRGTDKQVYPKAAFQNYTVFSLWDTYRAEHPLLTITQPRRVDDMVQSMLAIYQQQKMLPIWHLMGSETECMIGYHAVPVITDAYFKGFKGFDAEAVFEAMKATAMLDRKGVKFLKEYNYIPSDKENESVAKALEYAIDDACIAKMAKALNKQEDYEYFSKRSKTYAAYFDKETLFMRGRLTDGTWRTPFDPIASKHRHDDYCEGNAWQYIWLVPQDPAGLIGLFGSEEAFLTKLDTLFSMSSELGEGASADISGLIGQYAHGNEPGHHITYLYAFAGQPWKTAEKVRQIMTTMYTDQPDGLCGNEDCGQMSAWYVLSAMGFYPVHPANGVYVLGSPEVDKATIVSAGKKPFTIEAVNNSEKNIYIQSVQYNGQPYTKGYITHSMITKGGTLTLEMGPEPNKSFAVAPADRPKSEL
jgi:predicted alpha-1,2-mannosidase